MLLFVCLTINYSGAWLVADDTVYFTAQVGSINIQLNQGEREITAQDNNIYLGTNVIEKDTDYTLNITLTNKEEYEGYYVRYKVVAQINGEVKNANDIVSTSLYKSADGWIYVSQTATLSAMTGGQTVTLIDSINISSTLDWDLSSYSGKLFRLYLYVQGSPVSDFTV